MKHVHFMGIGGSGASAVAAIAQAQGFKISGCDKIPHNEFTQHFNEQQLLTGHSSTHLEGVDILAITPAITSLDSNNEELVEAKKRGIPVMTWQQFMGEHLEKDKFVIAVCGTHGKSSTTAMIGMLLEDAGLDPTVELGANVKRWGGNFRIGKSKYFITEADEFNDNFLATKPDIAVITTVEMDHPEYFADLDSYKESFEKFLEETRVKIVANMSDPEVGDVVKYVMKRAGKVVMDYSKNELNLKMKVPGKHMQMNAAAAFQVGLLLGIDPAVIRQSLENYPGIDRRMEKIGELNGAHIYSDFGHHPTEIRVNLEAIREEYPDKKIWVIFQPHMFSRTKALFEDFVKVFQNAPVNGVAILDIYPSREIDTGLVTTKQLIEAIKKENVEYTTAEEIVANCKKYASADDVFLFLGAGDTDKLAREVVSEE